MSPAARMRVPIGTFLSLATAKEKSAQISKHRRETVWLQRSRENPGRKDEAVPVTAVGCGAMTARKVDIHLFASFEA